MTCMGNVMQTVPLDLVELYIDSKCCRAQSVCAECSCIITEVVGKLDARAFHSNGDIKLEQLFFFPNLVDTHCKQCMKLPNKNIFHP